MGHRLLPRGTFKTVPQFVITINIIIDIFRQKSVMLTVISATAGRHLLASGGALNFQIFEHTTEGDFSYHVSVIFPRKIAPELEHPAIYQ